MSERAAPNKTEACISFFRCDGR